MWCLAGLEGMLKSVNSGGYRNASNEVRKMSGLCPLKVHLYLHSSLFLKTPYPLKDMEETKKEGTKNL
jgi:hypothetical protein